MPVQNHHILQKEMKKIHSTTARGRWWPVTIQSIAIVECRVPVIGARNSEKSLMGRQQSPNVVDVYN